MKYQKNRSLKSEDLVLGLTPTPSRKVKEFGDLIIGEPAIEEIKILLYQNKGVTIIRKSFKI